MKRVTLLSELHTPRLSGTITSTKDLNQQDTTLTQKEALDKEMLEAAFDILLCALSSVEDGRFYILRHNDLLWSSDEIAYADDLVSATSTISGLQLKADIVSAYAIIFGLDIATSKLRTFLHHPSGKKPNSSPQRITIHTSGWIPTHIRIATSGKLKALGKLYDISSIDLHKTQYEETLLRAQKSCNILQRT